MSLDRNKLDIAEQQTGVATDGYAVIVGGLDASGLSRAISITTNVGQNVIAFTGKRNGTTLLAPNYSANHITTNTTTTITAATAYLQSMAITVSTAGTAWTIKIQNKEATPKVFYPTVTAAVGVTQFSFDEPLLMTSGIDIITAGTTPGTVDIFLTYWQ